MAELILDDYVIKMKDKLGKGDYGVVYLACKNKEKSCDYVAKFISQKEFKMKEYELSKKAYDLGIAPFVHLVSEPVKYKNKIYRVMIFEKLKENLLEACLNNKILTKDYSLQLLKLLNILDSNDIFHGDLHIENFMFDYKGKLKVIDFGLALPDEKTSLHLRNKFNFIERLFIPLEVKGNKKIHAMLKKIEHKVFSAIIKTKNSMSPKDFKYLEKKVQKNLPAE